MVAPVYTNQDILTALKQAINDTPTDSTDQWLSDDVYRGFIHQHIITEESSSYTYTRRVGSGAVGTVWTNSLGANDGEYYYEMSFTGTNDCTYIVDCRGSIRLSVGTDASTTLTVTATPVDFAELVISVCQYLITALAQKAPVAAGSGSYTPPDEDRLVRVMEYWRGIVVLQ